MSAKANRRNPLSARVRKVAASVVADAAELRPSVTWVFARVEGDDLMVVCSTGDNPPALGDRVTPEPERDLTMPLVLPDGSTFGVLCGLGGAEAGRDPTVAARLERWSEVVAAVAGAEWEVEVQTSKAEAVAKRAHEVEVEALTDALTGVANRRAWDRAVEAEERRRRRYGGTAAVIVVDLDELKHINDSQGHLHGDLVIRLIARVIQQTSRESDLVARTGGDEFAVLALNCEEADLRVLVSRLRKALETEGVSASVGGACRRPSAGMAEAWAEADDVMFEEKARRKLRS
ncbi:MAG: diguanylate cyclase [Acidimicrobiales bacterium]